MIKSDELYQKAYHAYRRDCDRHNAIVDEPSATDSTIGRKYVHLNNSYRKLARYEIATGTILR